MPVPLLVKMRAFLARKGLLNVERLGVRAPSLPSHLGIDTSLAAVFSKGAENPFKGKLLNAAGQGTTHSKNCSQKGVLTISFLSFTKEVKSSVATYS